VAWLATLPVRNRNQTAGRKSRPLNAAGALGFLCRQTASAGNQHRLFDSRPARCGAKESCCACDKPVPAARSRSKAPPAAAATKSREEIESDLADGPPCSSSSSASATRRCSATRSIEPSTPSHAGRAGDCSIGHRSAIFLELEGSPAWIDRTACALGYSRTTTSRRAMARCTWRAASRGVEPGHMVFASASAVIGYITI